MKLTEYKTYLRHALVMMAFAGVVSACVEEDIFSDNFLKSSTEGLSVTMSVSEPTVVTRADGTTDSDDALKEKYLQTLDVFVEHITGGTPDGTFIRQYHLVATTEKPIQEQVNNWLANNWRAEGLVIGEYYNIYVATNNTQTAVTQDLETFNVEALKALVADEVTDGVAVVDAATNNITWADETTTSGNIYKLYNAAPGSYRALTSDKKFMMDGILENWTPDPETRDQVFKPVILSRAAAKIVVNVNFDADFLKSLTHNKVISEGTPTWVEKRAAEQESITGSAAWKFNNFAFGAPVFAPETQGDAVQVHNCDFNIIHNQAFMGDDKHFQIITYTYPNKWAAANYATDAPSLVISVPFTMGTGNDAVTTFHYYRIPLVKNTVTAIERNHIYVINATIATRGSEIIDDLDETENIKYAVLPWNDDTNSEATHSEVESVQHYYFNANPKVYTLRGDGNQSVTINYSKAAGTKVNWKLFTYDANGNQTGIVANDANGAVRAWFYDADGDFTTTYGDSNQNPWPNMGVTITQSNEGTSGSNGTVTVTSTALTNKAIKYIRLRVYLDEENDQGQPLEETYHEDILIRHFPTDNIQSIDGHWSSYHDVSSSSQYVTLTTSILSEAQSWAEQYGVEYQVSEITESEYIDYDTYLSHSSDTEHYHMYGPTASTYNAFHTAIQEEYYREIANSQANAVLDGGEGNTYYWGTGATRVASNTRNYNGQWDYRVWSSGMINPRYDYYKYSNYYSATYTHTNTRIQYSVSVPMTSTGYWVDWDIKTSHSAARTYQYSYASSNNTFKARVFERDHDAQYIYEITESGSNYNGWTTTWGSRTDLQNYHMYVIQISATSSTYVLGRPYVNATTHQSQDNVVSPAFMIASQLGAVSPFTGNDGPTNAATHCSRYMEVADDGTRYTGWRLPTEAEIKVITGYQFGTISDVEIPSEYRVIVPVLTGMWYHSLSGEPVLANPNAGSQSQRQSYLRCVRDLSAEEVARLNGFDKIQEKYR